MPVLCFSSPRASFLDMCWLLSAVGQIRSGELMRKHAEMDARQDQPTGRARFWLPELLTEHFFLLVSWGRCLL